MQERFLSFLNAVRLRRRVALDTLVDRYQGLARNTVRRHLGQRLRQRVESEDLLNDFWLSVFRHVEYLPALANSCAMRAYLRRIAFRQVTKQQRRHMKAECRSLSREVLLSDMREDDVVAREGSGATRSSQHEFLERLRSLTTDQEWRIVVLKLDGHSNRQIGRRLQVDEGSVRRCLRRIGRILAQHESSHT